MADNVGNCLKSLIWILKKDGAKNIIERLERHKITFVLALLALSMYLFLLSSAIY